MTGSAPRDPHIDRLLDEALQQPADARTAFLDVRCADDPEARAILEPLLRESDDQDPFLKPGGAFDGPLGDEWLSEPWELATGTRVGPYEVRGVLGAGGMGEVYRAHDTRLGRDVALKVLPRSATEIIDALPRFEREARAVAALSHPNILAIHDVGAEGDVHFIVTELLEGETLRRRLSDGPPLPPAKAIEYGVQIARGLAAAHDRGIVHRDLKPENVFITREGRVKILDFGVVLFNPAPEKMAGDDGVSRLTRPGLLVGTLAYASPEQVLAQQATSQADLFAFGVVMYEMLTGTHPFTRSTRPETEAAILRDHPVSVARVAPAVPPPIARLIERCLEKQPSDRPQSARDLALFFEAVGTGDSENAAADAGIDSATTRGSPTRLLAIAGGVLLLLSAATWGFVRVTADRVVSDLLEADLARAERLVRRVHDDEVTRVGLTARLVASFPELKALFATDVATIQDFLLGYQQRIPGTPLLIALAPDGTVLGRTDGAPAGAEIGDGWLRTLVSSQGERTVISIANRPHLAVAVPAEAGATVFGYLIAARPLDQAFAQTVIEATRDDFILLSPDGLLASTLRAAEIPWRSLEAWHAGGGSADRTIDVRIGSQRFAAREVTLTNEPRLSAVILTSRDEAMRPYLRMQRGVITIGVIAIAVGLLALFWYSRSAPSFAAAASERRSANGER